MKYKPYFSRFLNERKRKLKSAYLNKVITGVVAALVISSSSFTVMANENELHKMLEEDQTPGITITMTAEAEDSENSVFDENGDIAEADDIDVEDGGNEAVTEDGSTGGGIADESVTEDGAFGDYTAELGGYAEMRALYDNALSEYQNMKLAYAVGTAGASAVEEAYAALEDIYDRLVEAHINLEAASGNVDAVFEAELLEYKESVKEYKAAKAAYSAALREQRGHAEAMIQYNEAMAEYKAELTDYAKELSAYAKKLSEYKLEQANYELEYKQYELAMQEFAGEMGGQNTPQAPAAPLLVKPEAPTAPSTVKPEKPAEAEGEDIIDEAPVRPELPGIVLDEGVNLEAFDLSGGNAEA